ncbi:MAG: replicative DNA helicase [Candidatus Tokpelaia sp. JSC085]|nr:MAG: replicative DNA helicase [Candidatus Tokpelaia sp. JSC085]
MSYERDQNYVSEAEQDLLGSCLSNPVCYTEIRSIIKETHFIHPVHQAIYKGCIDCFDCYNTLNVPLIAKQFSVEDNVKLKHEYGKDYMEYMNMTLANALTGVSGIKERAHAVLTQWARIKLSEKAEDFVKKTKRPFVNLEELVSTFNSDVESILSECRHEAKRKTRDNITNALNEALLHAEDAKNNKNRLTGITWGLLDLNRKTGGIQKRDLTLVGARPSMGKTTFATSIAIAAAKGGTGVGIISLEMDRTKLAARMASDLAYDWDVKVPYFDIINGQISDDDLQSIKRSCDCTSALPIMIDDQSGLTITDIRIKLESMITNFKEQKVPLNLLIIDHLGLIRSSNRYLGNRTNEIAEITAGLKSMAREYNIAIILLSQLNRQLETRVDKRPQLADLRDSGAIEQDADTILFLYREDYYLSRERYKETGCFEHADVATQNTMEIAIAKQRNGDITKVNVFTDMAYSVIRNGIFI